MKKTVIILLVCLLSLAAAFAQSVRELGTPAQSESTLPSVGDVVKGFKVVDKGSFDLIGSDTVLFEHVKTGAQVLYLANEDTNRVFEITFKTPTEVDTGVPHVFEHSTLDGSAKYPSKALFFNLSFQTYNTYMNASTYSHMTTFPVASLSEQQLLKYADYYTDSCFNPMLYSDQSIFDEEAWRFSMADEDSPLTIEGTVYSEMLGARTRAREANLNFNSLIFPGSIASNDSGGNPDHIPEMTRQDLLDYHQKYYTPSNSLTCLYGKFEDYEAFLEMLDGYFAAYERTEFNFVDAGYTPIDGYVENYYQYPVEASSRTDNSTTVYYGFVCGDLNETEINKLDLLTTVIGDASSALMENLRTVLPSGSFSCYIDFTGPECNVCFVADSINPEDAELFKATVDSSLAQIASEGFDKDAIDAIIAAFKLSVMLTTEDSSIGVNMIPNIAYYWAATDDVYGYMDYIDAIDLFDDYYEDGSFIEAINTYLIGNDRRALATTYPVAGLKEAKAAALADALAQLKASMTPEQIQAIVNREEPEETVDTAALLKELQAVTVESLPEEIRIYDITDDMGDDGVRRLFAETDTDGIGYASILLNADGIDQELLHFFKLYVDLLGDLDTSEHTRTQLASLINRYLYQLTIKVSVFDDENGALHPYMRSSFIALDEDMEDAYNLLAEILFDSQFDVQRVADSVAAIKASLKNEINNNSYSIMLYRMFGEAAPDMAYFSYMNYLDYYNFLEEFEQYLEVYPEMMISYLQYIQSYFQNSYKAVSMFAGSKESNENHTLATDSFLSTLACIEVKPQTYEFPKVANESAMIVDSTVNYNLIFASYDSIGLEDYSGDFDAISSLISDAYLYPMLRDQYGVYSVATAASEDGIYMFTYRDPNILESFQVFAGLPAFLADLEIDQETLDGYILSSYSGYAMSAGELTGALNALLNHMDDKPQELILDYMRQLKGVKAETVNQYADIYMNVIANGMLGTTGSAAAINGNAYLYSDISNPFGVADASQVVFTDITEDDFYFEAVRFSFENGLMAASGADIFGCDSPATLGDLAAVFYQLIGGPRNPEEAVQFFASYGVVPADPTDTELSRLEAALYTNYFFQVMGMDAPEMPIEEELVDADQIPEGYEGLAGWALDWGLLVALDGVLAPMDTMTRAELAYLTMMIAM